MVIDLDHFSVEKLSLVLIAIVCYGGSSVVIPGSLQSKVLNIIHEEHTGVVRMKWIARGVVRCPKIDAALEKQLKLVFNVNKTVMLLLKHICIHVHGLKSL